MPEADPALLSAEDMLAAFSRRHLTPVDVLQAVTERVARLNPGLNAFAVLNPGALQAAGESASRWRSGRPAGSLDGVPCTVKDLVDLAGFPTRRGSRTTSAEPAADDAPMVAGLKAAGAVIVGKTTTTEFGWKSPGDCPLHGITRNPWNTAYTTGGSSSGAGAAGAAGFGPLHIGTDAGGSVRIPAAWCGLVGLKPTYGRIPQWPASAFASVSCAGPMTRTVRDAALMLGAMARWDLRDPFCLPDDPRDWLDGIEAGVEGLSVGVLRSPASMPLWTWTAGLVWSGRRRCWRMPGLVWKRPRRSCRTPAACSGGCGARRWRVWWRVCRRSGCVAGSGYPAGCVGAGRHVGDRVHGRRGPARGGGACDGAAASAVRSAAVPDRAGRAACGGCSGC